MFSFSSQVAAEITAVSQARTTMEQTLQAQIKQDNQEEEAKKKELETKLDAVEKVTNFLSFFAIFFSFFWFFFPLVFFFLFFLVSLVSLFLFLFFKNRVSEENSFVPEKKRERKKENKLFLPFAYFSSSSVLSLLLFLIKFKQKVLFY